MSEQIYATIEDTIFDTVGCTEPVAVAYAATAAYHHVGGSVESIVCTVSVNVLKNAMSVGIPGSNKKGIPFAVALGLTAGDWEKGLRIFENADEQAAEEAARFSSQGKVEISLYEGNERIYIHTKVRTDSGTAEALIRETHDGLRWVKVDGKLVYGSEDARDTAGAESTGSGAIPYPELEGLTMEELVRMVEELDDDRLLYLEDGVDVNMRAAEHGLSYPSGMGLGIGLTELSSDGVSDGSLAAETARYVAAAADSRMSGGMIPIKGCGGSGNHGITFFLTVGLAYGRYKSEAVRTLAKTIAMGLMLVRYIKAYTGLLTPTCGVTVSAAPAAAAAIVYALGGSPEAMTAAVKLIYGNIAGILCDGAKHGCALKASTSARTGIEAAFLALEGVRIPPSDGIVDSDLPSTMEHFRYLQDRGLVDADRTMLDILVTKAERLDGSE